MLLVALMSPSAFAGQSADVLTCTGPARGGHGKLVFTVMYEFPHSGGFRPFLGFSAQQSGAEGAGYYCFGACGNLDRNVENGKVYLQLGTDLTLVIPESLTQPGNQGQGNLEVTLEGEPDSRKILYQDDIQCTSHDEAERLLDTGT